MIFDTDGNPITTFSMSLDSAEVSTATIQVECRDGYRLYADAVADCLIEGRKQGDLAWVNLETSEIGLTPFAGTRQLFEISLTAGVVAGPAITRRIVKFKVTP